MEWSREQENALKSVNNWLNNSDQQVFRLFGYAGTGKTTLAKHFADNTDKHVLFAAYTGKAAYVLKSKGCSGAGTIHSLIYHTKSKGATRLKELEKDLVDLISQLRDEGKDPKKSKRVEDIKALIEKERDNLSRPAFSLNHESPVKDAGLIVIDECSMVNEEMGQDLLSFGTKVLVLGDPAQLPPVGGGGFFTEKVKPDVMLTDIHRQAKDNPIIDMATRVRNGQPLPLGLYGNCSVVEKSSVKPEDALEADQILVGKNATRFNSNSRFRKLRGIDQALPIEGEKLVCLRNNHELGLLNGAIFHVVENVDSYEDRVTLKVSPEDDEAAIQTVECHQHHFIGSTESLPWWERTEAEEFDYGYALTTHKAQGSQWDNVLLFDESSVFRQNAQRWLYTGITRAAEQIKVVRF